MNLTKKMKCVKTTKSIMGTELFTVGKEYIVHSTNKQYGSYVLVANNGDYVNCTRTKRGKNFVEASEKKVVTPKKVICVKPEPGIRTVGKVYDVVNGNPENDVFEIVSDNRLTYYCRKLGIDGSHFKLYVEPEVSTVIEWSDKEPKQTVSIDVPEGYKIKSQKVVDNQIVVELEKLKPVFKMGDVLTNGMYIWIRDIGGDAVIVWVIGEMREKCAINLPLDSIRYANYEERCKFFEELVKAGYKWNSKKLKLSKPVPKPKVNIVVVSSTDIVLTIKPEYLEKLKALGVYDQWLSNVKAQYAKRGEWCCIEPDKMLKADSFYSLIKNYSFKWNDSPEGFDFWYRVVNK